jgi:ubiquinone/menaquinone biosynthesis C-methylase UbiE
MPKTGTEHLENTFKQHYAYLAGRAVRYDYKLRKATRIVQILEETGGLGAPVLEIGVGSGGIAAGVSRAGVRVVGTDIAPAALLRAQEYCANDDVALLFGSGFRLPFRDAVFPLVYASQVLHLFDSDARATLISEVRRVLKPAGRFVFDLKNRWSHPFAYYRRSAARRNRNFPSDAEIRDVLQRCGFAVVAIRPGLLPLALERVSRSATLLRVLTHTRFFVASPS